MKPLRASVAVLWLLACGGQTDQSGSDASADAAPTPPPSAEARGWRKVRSIAHLHSAFSHDACDNWISDHPGEVSATCIDQLRAGICESGLDVAFLSDHPAHMREYDFSKLLLTRTGDTLVGPNGAPYANVMRCPDGPVPAHDAVIAVGYESTHDMVAGLHNHFGPLEGKSFTNATPMPEVKETVEAIHAAGGISLIAHSEEDDISAQFLVDSGVDAMEVYNIHANFLTVTGSNGDPKAFQRLAKFLEGADTQPNTDLVVMAMLAAQPEKAFQKWQKVNQQRHVTAIMGNDTHQNVALYLWNGERIDRYGRMLRVLSNHTLVPTSTAVAELTEATKAALVAGRNWATFDLLGRPEGLDWVAGQDGKWVEAGGVVKAGATLWLRTPTACAPMPGAAWSPADTADSQVRAIVWRLPIGAGEPEKFQEVPGWGKVVPIAPTQAGRYHVELRIVPKHLSKYLQGLEDQAAIEHRWAVGNPIEVK
jgi:hypothetical protein